MGGRRHVPDWGGSVNGSRGFFVEIDSYAIAFLRCKAGKVTRWGLFLMREVQLYFLSL